MAKSKSSKLTKRYIEILEFLNKRPEGVRAESIEKFFNLKNRTAYNRLSRLKDLGLIENIFPIWKKNKKANLILKEYERQKRLKELESKCFFCGYDIIVEIHHIIPKCKGGGDNAHNLINLCPNCHRLIHRGIFNIEGLFGFLVLRKIKDRDRKSVV